MAKEDDAEEDGEVDGGEQHRPKPLRSMSRYRS
jgi:hypothetical protein